MSEHLHRCSLQKCRLGVPLRHDGLGKIKKGLLYLLGRIQRTRPSGSPLTKVVDPAPKIRIERRFTVPLANGEDSFPCLKLYGIASLPFDYPLRTYTEIKCGSLEWSALEQRQLNAGAGIRITA